MAVAIYSLYIRSTQDVEFTNNRALNSFTQFIYYVLHSTVLTQHRNFANLRRVYDQLLAAYLATLTIRELGRFGASIIVGL